MSLHAVGSLVGTAERHGTRRFVHVLAQTGLSVTAHFERAFSETSSSRPACSSAGAHPGRPFDVARS